MEAAVLAAAAMAGIPRGQLVSLAVPCVFLLGVLWVASALNIARSVERCLAVEGSVSHDHECLLLFDCSSSLAIIHLIFMLIWVAVVTRVQDVGGAQDRRPDDELRPQRRRRYMGPPDADAVYPYVFFSVYMCCGMLMLLGKALGGGAARRIRENPADEGAAFLLKFGPWLFNAGFLSLSVQHCCFIIPCVLIGLMRLLRLRENAGAR
ncbi:hypothetical protein ACP70R_000867 [Stipagrostis hirtigluma subsp. patula]